ATFFGNFSQVRACPSCRGIGNIPNKICGHCDGTGRLRKAKEINVAIAPGVVDGQILKIAKAGEAGERGAVAGDLYLVIRIKPHSVFVRKEGDLYTNKEIKMVDAFLKRPIKLNDISGESFEMEIPANWHLHEKIKILGRGMPRFGSHGRGDLFVQLELKTPGHLSSKAKALLEELEGEL
ncbi:MAG: DnaJ C-terminal domain-containing protein, partial [bacterium]|nr:DnaJ C-terminal domain-containing protein [bacterium]